jgi:hypothetical protein
MRLHAIEQAELSAQAEEAKAFMREANAERMAAIAASAAKIREEMLPEIEEHKSELAAEVAALRASLE